MKKIGKRFALCALIAALLVLGGCSRGAAPDRAADGEKWDDQWITLGGVLGVEGPDEGFELLDGIQAWTFEEIYLVTWKKGDPIPYVTAEGEDAQIYEAQLYLLLKGYGDAQSAQADLLDWIARENETYAVGDTRTEVHNGQEFTVLTYQTQSETNPYSRGASAFCTVGKYAITAEIACLDRYGDDEEAVLSALLDGFHYASLAQPSR